jgi:hypothetical protein
VKALVFGLVDDRAEAVLAAEVGVGDAWGFA